MWIVRLALRRPYTFVVVALLIVALGIVTFERMSTGISPDDMEKRVITITERAFTTTVNDIEHIESQSMYGVGVIKVFFHPNAKIEMAVAQITAISQTLLRAFPAGI